MIAMTAMLAVQSAAVASALQLDVILLIATGWRAATHANMFESAVDLPAVAAMAARGVRFTHAYTVSAEPAFAMAALLTGLYPGTLAEPHREFPSVLATAPSVVERFRVEGWRTVHVGAWRLGTPPARLGYQAAALSFGDVMMGRSLVSGFDERAHRVASDPDDWITEQAVAVIRAESAPLFLTVVWHGPAESATALVRPIDTSHAPLLWDDELIGRPAYLPYGQHRVRAKMAGATNAVGAGLLAAQYRVALAALDRRIGQVWQAIEIRRVGRPACVVLTSLHGWLAGEHGLLGAGLPYEPSIHIPLIIVAPGLPRKDDRRWALTVDVAPTVASLAGVRSWEPCHGQALWPPSAHWRTGFLHELPVPRDGARATWTWREGELKYIRTEMPGEPGTLASEELYDLVADPYETNNLAIDRRRQGEIGALAGALRNVQCEIELDRRRLRQMDGQSDKRNCKIPLR